MYNVYLYIYICTYVCMSKYICMIVLCVFKEQHNGNCTTKHNGIVNMG